VTQSIPALGSYTDVNALGSVAVNAARRRMADRSIAAPTGSVPGPLAAGKSPATTTAPALAPASGAAADNGSLQYNDAAKSAGRSPTTTSKRATQRVRPCSAAKFADPGEHLSMRAWATLNGRPVQVYVFEGRDESTVVVLGGACRLVNVQTLG
jgi:hypothetical protein